MDFKTNKPIYKQITDFCFNKILMREWKEEERIPSVRELAELLSVNPHTVLKSFEYLQDENIIYTKRGLGFFLSANAMQQVTIVRKNEFFDDMLIKLFETMDLLDIDINEVIIKYNNRNGGKK